MFNPTIFIFSCTSILKLKLESRNLIFSAQLADFGYWIKVRMKFKNWISNWYHFRSSEQCWKLSESLENWTQITKCVILCSCSYSELWISGWVLVTFIQLLNYTKRDWFLYILQSLNVHFLSLRVVNWLR